MRLLIALACALLVAAIGSAPVRARMQVPPTTRGFAIAAAPYRFHFPRDHAAHDDYKSEWWYYTGHVVARDGRRFGYELTFFRYGLRPGDPPLQPGESRWRGNQLYPAHFAITDERGRRFVHYERFAREALGAGSAATDRLRVRADQWRLDGGERNGRFVMRMQAGAAGDAIDLVQTPQKPPAINGRGGVSRKGACTSCASHYYSFTRLATSGTMHVNGVAYRVHGITWMDHEYGSGELEPHQSGWDWFSLQLDDGRELMLYRLRQDDGTTTPESSGTLVERDGTTTYLPLSAFSTSAIGTWTSPHTQAHYPSGWHVRVPSAGIDVTLTPVLLDQELDNVTGGISYWEGAVDVTGAGGKRAGTGYVELTGYASGNVRM